MLFKIEHYTRYDYSLPVNLGEHTLRFLPRDDNGQRPVQEQLQVDPAPVSRSQDRDAWGNRIERLDFVGETGHLEIRAHLLVETSPATTPQWLGPLSLPCDYAAQADWLAPYLAPLEKPGQLDAFIAGLLQRSGGYAPDYLDALNRALHGFYHRGVRLHGAARSPAETLRRGEGVCRDLALLFMACARQVGLATRFVSGYQQGEGNIETRQLHAWAEVYLPGAGWIGYDPTHGATTSEEHIAIACAPTQALTMPLEGGYTFQGEKLTSTLTTEIRINTR